MATRANTHRGSVRKWGGPLKKESFTTRGVDLHCPHRAAEKKRDPVTAQPRAARASRMACEQRHRQEAGPLEAPGQQRRDGQHGASGSGATAWHRSLRNFPPELRHEKHPVALWLAHRT